MATTQLAQNERAAWLLKKHGFQVLVLTEDDRVVISDRVTDRAVAGELMMAALDLKQNPSVALGPNSTQVSLNRVVSTRRRSARNFLDLETDTEIHRIGGWKTGAMVLGGQATIGAPARGGSAASDAQRRIRHRLEKHHSYFQPATHAPNGETSRSLTIRPWRMMVEHWIFLLSGLGIGVYLAQQALPPSRSGDYLRLAVSAACFLFAFFTRPPGPLVVDEKGISWGTKSRPRRYHWSTIGRFFGESTGNDRGLEGRGFTIFVPEDSPVIDEQSFRAQGGDQLLAIAKNVLGTHRETKVEPTNYMSGAQRNLFLATVAIHKPDFVLLSRQASWQSGTEAKSTAPKELRSIAILGESRRRFWFIAIPLAVIVPPTVLILILMSL